MWNPSRLANGLNHCLVELCRIVRDVLRPEYLTDASPSGLGFPQLCTNHPDVVIILHKQASQVFEQIHLLQNIPMDGKLLPEG